MVRLELRRPFKDGTVAVDLDPLSLLCRLAASVPPLKMHTVRFAGVLSAAQRWALARRAGTARGRRR